MQQLTDQHRLKPWMGFALFALVMALFVTAGSFMQTHWGLTGLLLTEVMFLIVAVSYCLVFRIPVKEMFPVKKFSARDFFGSLLLTLGGLSFGMLSIFLVGIIYPKALESNDIKVLSELSKGSSGYVLTLLILSLSPAICEEAIHRGAILSNFRSIKKDWIIVLIMGILFGINHLSVARFINTALLGACLSYIVVKKNNIILSSIMHFTVNFGSMMISFISNSVSDNSGAAQSSAQMTSNTMLTALPVYLLFFHTAPFFIVAGLWMLSPSAHKKIRFLFAGILSVIMVISAIVTAGINAKVNEVADSTLNYTVYREQTEGTHVDFEITKEGKYNVVCQVINSDGEYEIRINDSLGENVFSDWMQSGTKIRTYSNTLDLEEGEYSIYLVSGKASGGDHITVAVRIIKAG